MCLRYVGIRKIVTFLGLSQTLGFFAFAGFFGFAIVAFSIDRWLVNILQRTESTNRLSTETLIKAR